jgi:hypothetical protein
MSSRLATCACGAIRLNVEGDPHAVSMCHCQVCQRRTGSTYSVHAYFSRSCVKIEGSPKTYSRTAKSERAIESYFCPDCGSTMFWGHPLRVDQIGIPIGALTVGTGKFAPNWPASAKLAGLKLVFPASPRPRENAAMFAPKVAKPQTKAAADSTNKLAPGRSVFATRPFGGEQAHLLQRSIGNQATLRLLGQRTSKPRGDELGGDQEKVRAPEKISARETPRGVAWSFSKIPLFPPDRASRSQTSHPLPGIIQPKLAIGQVDDPLEHEADRVADHVMRIPEPDLSIGASLAQMSFKYAACEAGPQALQTNAAKPPQAVIGEAPSIVHRALRSPGEPLDPRTRAFFEPRFGHDFSQVRVHTDAKAAESAQALNALAYTLGRDVVFGAGHYSPGTSAGQRLLAHELVHTVQRAEAQQPEIALRQAAGGNVRKLQIFEPRAENLQRLVDAATKLQRYVGSVYSRLAENTTAQNPLTGAFFGEVSHVDGDVGEMQQQALLGVQNAGLPAQQYADIVYGLSSAKTRLDSILFRAGLARPARGGQVIAEFVDPYGETVDLSDVNSLMLQLGKGVIPGTPVEYGTDELLQKK